MLPELVAVDATQRVLDIFSDLIFLANKPAAAPLGSSKTNFLARLFGGAAAVDSKSDNKNAAAGTHSLPVLVFKPRLILHTRLAAVAS